MKLLNDLSIFEKQPRRLLVKWSHSSMYSGGRISRERRHVLPESHSSMYSLSCNYAAYQETEEYYFSERKNQSFFSAEYIVSGNLTLRYGKHCFVAEPGDCVLFHPHHDTAMLYLPGEPLVYYGFVFSGELLPAILRSLRLESTWCVSLQETVQHEDLCKRLMALMSKARCRDNLMRLSGCIYEFYQRLALQRSVLRSNDFAENIHQYLCQHFQEEINIEALASRFRVCPRTMNTRFAERFQQTPFQFLKQYRTEQAARLLTETELSVKEISALSGFLSPQHFSTEFLKFFGKTPGSYRLVYGRRK